MEIKQKYLNIEVTHVTVRQKIEMGGNLKRITHFNQSNNVQFQYKVNCTNNKFHLITI